ncbi:MAG TPA: ABC transporter ATP-binding protein [Bacillota bacterium]|nr:ABC transporter ATP-binding protein [Bacillota bacterium]
MQILLRLAGYLKPYLSLAFLNLLCSLLAIVLGMASPWLQKLVIDQGIIAGQYHLILHLTLLLAGFAAAKGLTNYFVSYLQELIGLKVTVDLRCELYQHLQKLSHSFYDKTQTGELMSRLVSDVEVTRAFLAVALNRLVVIITTITMIFITIWRLDWRLTLLSLVLSPFLLLVALRVHRKLKPVWLSIHKQMASLTTVVQENITGVRVVKSFARENYEVAKFDHENKGALEKHLELARIWARSFPLMDFLMEASVAIFVWFGAREVIWGRLSLGSFVAFNAYLWALITPLRQLGWVVNMFGQATTAGQRLFEILDTKVEIKDSPEARAAKIKGKVEFRNVSFAFAGQPVLRNIDLTVPAGSTVGIIGATGAGKSALVNLLARFYEPQEGEILIDDCNIRDFKLESLRSQIAFVPQETFLFSASIRENIAYGRPDASLEDVRRVAEIAQATEFITEFPDGYGTKVGERGVGLSGGQKQRIALARALLLDSPILILDDATSSVDMETELEIQQALRKVIGARTTFIIAQRLSAVKDADQIIVLDQGRITERGTHEELLAKGGYYAKLYNLQFRQAALAPLAAAH